MIRYHEDKLVIREADLPARLTRQRGKRKVLRYITRDEQRIYVQQGIVRAIKAIVERLRIEQPHADLSDAKDLLDAERAYIDERGNRYILGAKGKRHFVRSEL